jgi:hypothetical protein
MYSIQYVKGDQWQVMDESDKAVFVGKKQQVEDWLDHEENLQRRSSPHQSVDSIVRSLRQLIDRLAGPLSGHTEPRGGDAAMHSHATKR